MVWGCGSLVELRGLTQIKLLQSAHLCCRDTPLTRACEWHGVLATQEAPPPRCHRRHQSVKASSGERLQGKRQVWCLLQVKLCDKCLSALEWFEYHTRRYTSARIYLLPLPLFTETTSPSYISPRSFFDLFKWLLCANVHTETLRSAKALQRCADSVF